MNKIKIKVIEPETIEVFAPNGSSCGKLNELEFLDLRCQIKKYKVKGFYIYYNGNKVFIDSDGFLDQYVPIFERDIPLRDYLLGLNNNVKKD